MRLFLVFVMSVVLYGAEQESRDQLLNPDFEIVTEAGKQVFREELQISLGATSGATPENRQEFKRKAEEYARLLFRKGQEKYKLSQVELTVFWDWLEPASVAVSQSTPSSRSLHLNEIMFFTYHDEHMVSVIPHEVAHLVHYQLWGQTGHGHLTSFGTIVNFLEPNYRHLELDLTPSCRLSERLLRANSAVGGDPACRK